MLLRQFASEVRDVLQTLMTTSPKDVVLDADGTLWASDASEELLQWLEEQGHIQAPETSRSIMEHYNKLLEHSRSGAFSWAAQQCSGFASSQISQWSELSFEARVSSHVFTEMGGLVSAFQDHGWCVWIVSASPRFAIEPGARRLGVAPENIIAIELEEEQGVVTDRVIYPISTGQGKVTCIDSVIGRRPGFAAGNSVDDLPMLEHATETAMVVNPTGLHDATVDLADVAIKNGWLIHRP